MRPASITAWEIEEGNEIAIHGGRLELYLGIVTHVEQDVEGARVQLHLANGRTLTLGASAHVVRLS